MLTSNERRNRFIERVAEELFRILKRQGIVTDNLAPKWEAHPTRMAMFFAVDEILGKYGLHLDDPDGWNRLADAAETEKADFVVVSRRDLQVLMQRVADHE